jgi:hypothetical protein
MRGRVGWLQAASWEERLDAQRFWQARRRRLEI